MKTFHSLLFVLAFALASCEPTDSSNKQPEAHQWYDGAVWYALFPERFNNGDRTNDPTYDRVVGLHNITDWKITPWTQSWWEADEWMRLESKSFRDETAFRRYGGDLQGILDKLDYLKELGITAIWLNPIFDAQSLHKYDASSFHHIDRFFGPDPEADLTIIASEQPNDPDSWKWTSADSLFLKLIEEIHSREMKVILDGVFNHTGRDFWAFKDIQSKGKESEFASWYHINSFDDPATPQNEMQYDGWWGISALPELREDDNGLVKPVKEHIFAITKRWMDPNGDGDPSDGIDGWRLDVAEEVHVNFWKEWNQYVHQINPEAYTTAETWSDEAYEFMHEAGFDGVMNYRWAFNAHHFFVNQDTSAAQYLKSQQALIEELGISSQLKMMNLLDSHDTPRMNSSLMSPGRGYDREAQPEEGFRLGKPDAMTKKKHQIMLLHQYTWAGSPMIYYGTEVGMWGADDPHNRKPMWWPELDYKPEVFTHQEGLISYDVKPDADYYQLLQELATLRKKHNSLRYGTIKILEQSNSRILAYDRVFQGKRVRILINPTKSAQKVDLNAENLLLFQVGTVEEIKRGDFFLAPYSAVVIEMNY